MRSAGLDGNKTRAAVCVRAPGTNRDRPRPAHLGRYGETVEPEGAAIRLAEPPHHAYPVGLACAEGERARPA